MEIAPVEVHFNDFLQCELIMQRKSRCGASFNVIFGVCFVILALAFIIGTLSFQNPAAGFGIAFSCVYLYLVIRGIYSTRVSQEYCRGIKVLINSQTTPCIDIYLDEGDARHASLMINKIISERARQSATTGGGTL